jgi:tetratricopeptide (TPR) repeat protein
MIQGENAPCFYCGDKRHLSMNCPSKDLNEMTQGLEQLGYFSLNEINNMYFQFLTTSGQRPEHVPDGNALKSQPNQWANLAFYDLRAVYQLRFFRAIWDSKYDEWNKIKEKKNEGDKGGMVWIGQDCLRVANHEQAESILNEVLRKDAYDYKTYCALGLLKMEQDNFYQAEHFFRKALNHCKSGPQNILLNFFLARLFELKGDLTLAEERIRKILHLDPFCHEAIYQEIIYQFKKGRKSSALSQLLKLIKKSREYFINALIDPELAHYNDIIHPSLRGLLNEAKSEALQLLNTAKDGLEKLDKFLGPDAKEVIEVKSLWNKIEELLKKDSYFGYLDIAHYAGSILYMSHTGLEERRKKLIRYVNDLNRRLDAFNDYLADYPHKFLSESLDHDLHRIRQKLEQNINIQDFELPQGFKESMVLLEKLQRDLDQNEAKIMRLETLRKIIFYIGRFSKACLIFQTASLFISLVLFPIITYYLSFVIPRFNVSPQSIWSTQKSVLILGTVSGLFLSILYCTKRVPRRRLPF